MRISDVIVKLLEINGVKYIFGIPASTFAGINDALNDSDIEYIITKNEAGASYSASKYADLSKKIGVCLLAGGVGVSNAINGINDAKRNKVPMLIICGDTKRAFNGKGAIQELDNEKMVSSITKYAKNILNEDEAVSEIEKAIKIAMTPPCGPVLISIPFDVQLAEFNGRINNQKIHIQSIECDDEMLHEAIKEINSVKHGIILVGKGARGLGEEIKRLSRKLKWPIISTPNAKGVINTDFDYYIGNYGFCSADGAVEYIEKGQIDCLLILGSSLGQTATRDFNDVLVRNKKVIRIDWDRQEFNKVFNEDISVYYDLKKAMPILHESIAAKECVFKKPIENKPYVKNHTGISLRLFFEKMPEILPKDTCIIGDMGDFFNYIFKYMPVTNGIDYLTSMNYACMGTGIAGAMGAYLADTSKTCAVVAGDGSFYMNGAEILTAREYNMPIIYFIINNAMLGLVRNGSRVFMGRQCKGKVEFKRSNIASIAQAMGVDSVVINSVDEIDSIKHLFVDRKSPLVVEVVTDGTEVFIDTDRIKKVN
ncbi:thiamine pyrophosphate-binding protein [Clostridium oryzae]|uniref:Acetolactate synthase isozyme 2 large subunit n=1 Tax=Clostridium oryzae TaxID=1450648 RepID=A0A1V4IXC7_9CLOT|nr:thiamine pyrophosphate-binding protein [Clostridium oryzae]OPJ64435.1 acetolactate synthase isozyme 2 large subunit [Clostridium oryzae]